MRIAKPTAWAACLLFSAAGGAICLLTFRLWNSDSRRFFAETRPDQPYEVRRAAWWRIAQRQAHCPDKILWARSGDPDPRIREIAAYAWGRVGGFTAKSFLQDIALNDPVGIVRRTAVSALAAIPGAIADEKLREFVAGDDPYKRQAAALALRHRSDPEAIRPLFEAAHRPDELGQWARRTLVRTTTPLLESMGRSDLLLPDPESESFAPAAQRADRWLRDHLLAEGMQSNVRWADDAAGPLRRVRRLRRARRSACRILRLPRPDEWHHFTFTW